MKDLLNRIDQKLDKLEEKLDAMDGRVDSVDKTLAVQAKDIQHHIERTDQNEELIFANTHRIEKVEKVNNIFVYGWKIISGFSIVFAIGYGIMKILN